MLWKKRLTMFIFMFVVMAFGILYTLSYMYLAEPFFVLPLTAPTTPIRELFTMHYALSSYVVRTPVAIDAAGRFYITGLGRDKMVKILVLDSNGKIIRIITPRLMNGQPMERCYHFSVSPSGTRIWTLALQPHHGIARVTLHKLNGFAESEWILQGNAISYWRIYAYSEGGAYAIVGDGGLACFHFVIGRTRPREFKMPIVLVPIFFHNGMFWQIENFDNIKRQISKSKIKQLRAEVLLKRGWTIVTWTPEEGLQLVRECLSRFPIHWIDSKGNFYCVANLRTPIYHFLTLLLKIRPLEKLTQYLNILKPSESWIEAVKVFSPDGRLLESVALPLVIKPRKGEKLEYGQLIKVDETGIYLEVERVSEPREYRIVRIVKKPRWKVWWERLITNGASLLRNDQGREL